jgi:integrase
MLRMTGDDGNMRGVLTNREMMSLFPDDWRSVWPAREDYLISKLSACTGLRLGEILALKAENIGEYSIRPVGSYRAAGGFRAYLTKDMRTVPVPEKMWNELSEFVLKNGEGFLFSEDGGITPISDRRVRDHFKLALLKSGIPLCEIKKRGLVFHFLRHQFLMALMYMDIPSYKIQGITGYQPSDFYKVYRHIEHSSFSDVRKIQDGLFDFCASGEGGHYEN